MKKSSLIKLFTMLFFLIGALDLLVLVLNQLSLRFVFKPLIALSLAALYFVSVEKTDRVYLAALFFAFIGDTLLLFKGSNYFLLGLSSFLLAHLAFISILTKDIDLFRSKALVMAAIPFVFTTASVIVVVKEGLGVLLLPAIVYGAVITILGSLSFYNYLEKRDRTSLLLLLGVFLFVSSDGILAIERFKLNHRELELGVVIMTTYILAQYLICRYMIKKASIA